MKIKDILEFLDNYGMKYNFVGNINDNIIGFSSLSNYKLGSITWIKKEDGYDSIGRPKDISLAIVQDGINVDFNNIIYTESSKEVFFSIIRHFWGKEKKVGIGKGTIISENVKMSDTVTIGCNCTIVGNISIGENTVIEHNVVIQGKVEIGDNCHIQSGVVIGIDGYGYTQNSESKKKTMIEHFGGVHIGNNVFIGSHTNIARGTIDDTLIDDGVKIAPSTHIGHNNKIGKDAAIICSTLYGSSITGDRSYITSSTIANQITIGEDTVIGMGSVVSKPIESGVIAYGIPAVTKRVNDSDL
ncbi:UDP-3-O-[3-hydroxymyristoyl] glucosamine N-acyltransferase [Butyrivibrio sp. Su6]|uniref:DapH/DapD/GlmU-related protein n=1 Tax=Butyrivibrio sp. Su6 TaxID=1520810 RepID=UPI00089E5E6C|nr:DapH/DapD/GlmU-related protein [Butyrivibrio sp. Su6]SEG16914.1 UDP-3-O-[3-hydroxymyristoyl] glucosamine N-acyltransferase [Butyrivibrio sp. Su6]